MRCRIRLACALSFLCACGAADLYAEDDEVGTTDSSIIVGQVDWVPVTQLDQTSAEAKNALAVGYLQITAKKSRCTAWLVSDRYLVTNHHCISTASHAKGARVSFNYLDGVAPEARVWYACEKLMKAWSDVDAALLECTATDGKLPGELQGWVRLGTKNAAKDEPLYVVHQNCDYETQKCTPTKVRSSGKALGSNSRGELMHDGDTLGGSSGSPVFASSGAEANKVVGLHHAGSGGNSQGRGKYNLALHVERVRARLSEVLQGL
jgi:V8-like Glu-specific endopeptidase